MRECTNAQLCSASLCVMALRSLFASNTPLQHQRLGRPSDRSGGVAVAGVTLEASISVGIHTRTEIIFAQNHSVQLEKN